MERNTTTTTNNGESKMLKWTKIVDFRDDAIVTTDGRPRYRLVINDDMGDVTEDEASRVALPNGELPEHVWSSGGRWLAE